MKTVAMIPIKLNSERVKEKNLRPFCDGTPLVHFIQRALQRSQKIDQVYLYCSSDRIKDYLIEGVQYLQRPEYLDGNNCNCNDIIAEFIKEVKADCYVVGHATAPFTHTESIDKCIDSVAGGQYDSAFTVSRLQTFLWQDGQPLNFDLQRFPRTQDLSPLYLESSGAFAFSYEVFARYGRRVGVRPHLVEVSGAESIDIDTEFDMLTAQAIYAYAQTNHITL